MRVTAYKLPLRDRDGNVKAYAYISPEDGWAREFRWTLWSAGYAARRVGPAKNRKLILLHRQIMGLEEGDALAVDHINRERLDNRRTNLRVIPRWANAQNLPAHTRGGSRPSAHRGVTWNAAAGKWRVSHTFKGKSIYAGSFDDESEAATVARQWRREHMPYAVD